LAGIYVHIPFCNKACHYCDFHFSTSFKTKDQIINSINKEIHFRKDYLGAENINTIYFGGGTPSVLDKVDLESILNNINQCFFISHNPEITIEINPNDVSNQKIIDYMSLGINRVSIGGQSFCDQQLAKLNRSHTSDDVINCVKLIQDAGITNLNLDLMYGLPGMSNKSWQENLKKAVDLEITHLSCYCLTIERGTVFHKMVKDGNLKIDTDQKIKSQFLIMRKFLIKNHFDHYEISNFSKKKYESKHNTSYWNRDKYLGLGPSAHSYNGKERHWNISHNIKYIKALETGVSFFEEEVLTKKNIINEYILMGLRTNKGVSFQKILPMLNRKEKLNMFNQINNFSKQSLIDIKENYFFLTENGMILCDKITSDLFLV